MADLSHLCLHTPRLELRLATHAELRALGEVAQAGIHDPATMPFYVPWTDNSGRPGFVDEFVEHHESALRNWRADNWSLLLVAFADGQPVGVQGIRSERFAETRTVDTGSWLGFAWQGRGLGTELRAAVLSLAFDGLGALTATSGSIAGNPQSLGVSRKLGYRETGSKTVAPRGEPLEELLLELRRDEFVSPVPVEIAGLDGLHSRFGSDRLA
jgi:RimJ/RimL family protein N-acetyltransferase